MIPNLIQSLPRLLSFVVIALGTQMLVFPVAGLQMMLWQNLVMGFAFGGTSMLQGQAVQRFSSRPEVQS